MCGILGCSLKRPLDNRLASKLSRELDSLAHRGPDGRGVYQDVRKGIFLGHRRLAVIDVSQASAQPMERHGHVLSYNGEIYNYKDIAHDLEALDYPRTTDGDTEILLQSWLAWGIGAVDRFDGMFAFALFDGDRTHLVTDPFGEKPLYILTTSEGVYFASEPAPLHRLGNTKFDPTEEEQVAFLALGFLPAPSTGYPGLEKVGPAMHIEIVDGRITSRRAYWKPEPGFVGKGAIESVSADTLDELEDILTTSLRRRTIADVPLGLFLSSGVDSVLIAALLAKRLGQGVRAYTVAFDDGVDESGDAARIAKFLGVDHTIIQSRYASDGFSLADETFSIFGEPNDNRTAFSVRQMSKVSRPFMTVALSGTGGDEMFFGYQKYAFLYKNQNLYDWLGPLVDLLRPALGGPLDSIKALRLARQYIFFDPAWQFLAVKNNGVSAWLGSLPSAAKFATKLFDSQKLLVAFQARQFDLTNTMPQSYIAAIERGSMRESLEVRTPFLSRELYNKISTIDQRALIAFGRKKVAYDLLRRILPDELISQGKQGFVMPVKSHLSAMSDEAPRVSGVKKEKVEKVWKMRNQPSYQGLALRLDILAHAHNISGSVNT